MQSGTRMFGLKREELTYLSATIAFFFFYNLYRINYYPAYIDEAFTFVNFTSKGFLHSLCDYPEPNNHVFFSLISNIFYYFPFDSTVNLRLPNLLIGASSSIILYLFLKRTFSHKVAIIPHILFTFSYTITFYSVFGRGYMLIIFFTLISIISVYKLSQGYARKYLTLFTISSILGFYSVPIYLYVYASFLLVFIFLFYKKNVSFKQLLISNTLVVLAVILLYAPIIYYNGIEAITNNKFTQKLDRTFVLMQIKQNWKGIYDKLLGINSGLIIVAFLLLLAATLFISKAKITKQISVFVILFFLLPYVFMLLHSVIPGNRTWCYMILPLVIGVTLIINEVSLKIKIPSLLFYAAGILVILVESRVFNTSHIQYAHPYDEVGQQMALKVLKEGYQTFYFTDKEVKSEQIFIEFAYLSQGKKIITQNADLKGKNLNSFDCIVTKTQLTENRSIPKEFKEIYKDNTITIAGR